MSIEINDLSYVYNAGTAFEKWALDGVSLTIRDGDFVGLIGHTGSGKSTLIQHLNALLKPTRGVIMIDGEDINADKKKLKTVRQKVGLVFQYPEHQLFEVSVFKDVMFGPTQMGLPAEEAEERARRALEAVCVGADMYDKSPFELSGGQKRRVAIAGVLAMQPKVLILDEPTAGLDPQGRDEILSEIARMRKALGITVILVSHNMEDVSRLVDTIIVMHEGRVAQVGAPGEVFTRFEELEAIGLAAPQTAYLMRGLRRRGLDVPVDVFTVEKAAEVLAAHFGVGAR